jgi:hypothetical protein
MELDPAISNCDCDCDKDDFMLRMSTMTVFDGLRF